MKIKLVSTVGLVLIASIGILVSSVRCVADETLRVSTTLPTFAALVKEVGGDLVDVSAVASPHFNPHFVEPRPSDVLRVKRAALFVHGGLDLEAWRSALLEAVARPELRPGGDRQLDLSEGIQLLNVPTTALSRSQGDIHLFGNPHFWTDPETGIQMSKAIATKLSALAPEHAATFAARQAAFAQRLAAKITEWKKVTLPLRGKKLVAYHDEWAYLARFVGVTMEQFLEPKPGIPPSPQRLEALKQYMRTENIRAIIQPTYFPAEASNRLAAETGARVLLLCQSVGELPQCGDYLSMAQYNIESLVTALQ